MEIEFPCDKCPRVFRTKGALTKHELSEHTDPTRKSQRQAERLAYLKRIAVDPTQKQETREAAKAEIPALEAEIKELARMMSGIGFFSAVAQRAVALPSAPAVALPSAPAVIRNPQNTGGVGGRRKNRKTRRNVKKSKKTRSKSKRGSRKN